MAFHSKLVPDTELESFMAEARQRFSDAWNADEKDRQLAREDQFFEAGTVEGQWEADAIKARRDPTYPRPLIVENRVQIFCQQVSNDGRQSKPAILCSPGDRGTPETSELIQSWVRQIEHESNADVAYDGARDQQIICGRGAYRLTTAFDGVQYRIGEDGQLRAVGFRQVPRIEPINDQFSITWDPYRKLYDCSDADYCFVTAPISKQMHEYKYGKDSALAQAGFKVPDMAWINTGSGVIQYYETEYWRRVHEKATKCVLQSGAQEWKDELPDTDETGELPDPIIAEREDDRIKVQQFIIDGVGILDETEWLIDEIGIVPVWGREEVVDGYRYTLGLIRHAKFPQRLLNLCVSDIAEKVAQMSKTAYLALEGQLDNHPEWETLHLVARAFANYSAVKLPDGSYYTSPPKRDNAEPPIMALLALYNQSVDAIKASMGIFDASLGQKSNEQSGIAIQRRAREADNANFHFHDNEARSRHSLGRKLLKLLAKLNKGATIITVRGVDGKTKRVPINYEFVDQETGKKVTHIIDPDAYGIEVTTGQSYNSQREEAFDKLAGLLPHMPPQQAAVMVPTMIRVSNMPGSEDMADNLTKTLGPEFQPKDENGPKPLPPQILQEREQGKQAIMALVKQVQELEQQISSKEPELQVRMAIANIDKEVRLRQIEVQQIIALAGLDMKAELAHLQGQIDATKHSIEMAQKDADRDAQAVLAGQQKPVVMPRDKYVEEHQRLVDVLKNPTPEALAREADEQGKDLTEAQQGPVPPDEVWASLPPGTHTFENGQVWKKYRDGKKEKVNA